AQTIPGLRTESVLIPGVRWDARLSRVRRGSYRARARDRSPSEAHALDALALGGEHLHLEAAVEPALAGVRDLAEDRRHQAAHGVDLLVDAELGLERLLEPVDADAPVRHDAAVRVHRQRIALDVVLVLVLPDQFLDDVLDADGSRRAAVLVDHDRERDVAPLHLAQQLLDAL